MEIIERDAEVIEVIAQKLGRPADQIKLDDDFLVDLGADSLSLADLVSAVEAKAGTQIPCDRLIEVATVGDLVELLEPKAAS